MSRCARCDAEFECGADTGACWCATEDVPAPVLKELASAYRGCLCPDCLRRATLLDPSGNAILLKP